MTALDLPLTAAASRLGGLPSARRAATTTGRVRLLATRMGINGPARPLAVFAIGYPLWWLLGFGTLGFLVAAVPMALDLGRRRPWRLPPAFGLWLLFLVWVLVSAVGMSLNPPGTVPKAGSDRVISVLVRAAIYLSATVFLLWAGNLRRTELPLRRLVAYLATFFAWTLLGGLLGVLAPHWQSMSLLELALPKSIAVNQYVQSLVHPSAAQLQEVFGYSTPRPAAPFGYTNTWGYNYCVLVGWFVLAAVVWARGWRRVAGLVGLAASLVPVVVSLNRGLWIGLVVAALFVAVRLAMTGNSRGLALVGAGGVLVVVALVATPLQSVVTQRIDHGESNRIRGFSISKALDAADFSPVLGLGTTRAALGSAQSVSVGRSADCPKCGNIPLGSNGQLWLVIVAQGFVGAAVFLSFWGATLVRFWRDRTPVGTVGVLGLVLPFVLMFMYNADCSTIFFSMLALGALWRNSLDGSSRCGPAPRAIAVTTQRAALAAAAGVTP